MFRRSLFIGLACLMGCAALLVFVLAHDHEEAVDDAVSQADPMIGSSQQRREGVQKDLWVDGHHLHFSSPTSTATFDGRLLKETMVEVSGTMDDYTLVSDSLAFDGERIHLLGHTEIESPTTKVITDGTITVDYPDTITLLGSIYIQDEEKVAVADEVIYDLREETITLLGSPVLFSDGSHEISAKQVVYNREDKSVKGVGNVRLSLSEEETRYLNRGVRL